MFRFLLLLLHLSHVVHFVLRKCILHLPVQLTVVVVVVVVVVVIIIIIMLLLLLLYLVTGIFPPGTSLEPMVSPTAQT